MGNFAAKMNQTARWSALGLAMIATPVLAVDFGVFSDVTYSSSTDDNATKGFSLGQFDLFASHQIGDHTRGFVEFVFEGEDGGFVIDVERLSVQYAFNEQFNVAAGRFHTPIGYWNNVYHHGALLQDTVSRPSFIDFEDGADAILPMHIVGIMATGSIESKTLRVGYEFAVGNGASIDTSPLLTERSLDINNNGDPDNSKAIVMRVSFAPEKSTWALGVFGMHNNVAESSLAGSSGMARGETLVSQNIFGLDVKFDGDQFDGLAEIYVINNDNKVGFKEKHQATAAFAQLGYRFASQWKGVVRYETVKSDPNDDYFILLDRTDHNHEIVAIRYDIDDSSALKFEVDRSLPESGSDETTFITQWSFLIP